MHELLTFRRMITPIIIQLIFWIGVGASVIAGALLAQGGLPHQAEQNIALGVVVMLGGPFAARVVCEMLMVIFRIHATLEDIRADKAA